VASFVGAPPPPLPAIKKPDPTLASMAPSPSPAASPAEGDTDPAPMPAPVPAPTPKPVLAALSSPSPAVKPATGSVRYHGAYNVQVGAFTSQAEAENRLGMVQQRALDVLKGHLPFTASFMKGDQEWYRARFAGFSQDDAEAACAALKKLSLDCAIMLAE
jgi:D-alanyl-D-alanine carboxypeptidase